MAFSSNFNRFFPQLQRIKHYSTSISPILTNRNPRNLEKLRIGYKPDGYHVDKKGRNFWHKLEISVNRRHITATISHFTNGVVLKATTKEWALQKQLYSLTDYSAYVNLARVLAQRCLECGIIEFYCDYEPRDNQEKLAGFLKTLSDNGVVLKEPDQYKPSKPWDQHRPEKPWEINE
ncbi:large ribosomal subunit protein uL18m [Onthophagus taurus]|uniref:large ribosomal subunit protein uL18m n=1 Tax=Onthophagus taurus TaxID=166361 RepID=UPI0039BEC2FD